VSVYRRCAVVVDDESIQVGGFDAAVEGANVGTRNRVADGTVAGYVRQEDFPGIADWGSVNLNVAIMSFSGRSAAGLYTVFRRGRNL
jgi:hypothetical protein